MMTTGVLATQAYNECHEAVFTDALLSVILVG